MEVAGGLEALEDEGILLAADDFAHDAGLGFVVLSAADEGIKDLDEVQHVFVDFAFGGFAEVEKVQQFDFKADSLAADHNVVVVDIAVVFAARVNGGDALGQAVEDMEGLECGQPVLMLALEKFAELFAFHQLGDHHGHFSLFDINDFLVVILHEDRAMAQGIELAGVDDGGIAHRIAMGVIEFGGAADAGGAFDNRIHLAFPAAAEGPFDQIFSSDAPPGREIESLYPLAWSIRHGQ